MLIGEVMLCLYIVPLVKIYKSIFLRMIPIDKNNASSFMG